MKHYLSQLLLILGICASFQTQDLRAKSSNARRSARANLPENIRRAQEAMAFATDESQEQEDVQEMFVISNANLQDESSYTKVSEFFECYQDLLKIALGGAAYLYFMATVYEFMTQESTPGGQLCKKTLLSWCDRMVEIFNSGQAYSKEDILMACSQMFYETESACHDFSRLTCFWQRHYSTCKWANKFCLYANQLPDSTILST
jgi:hypothetical protein